MSNLSGMARTAFIVVLVAMMGLALYAWINQPRPLTEADLEATVNAAVMQRQTQTAVAVTPDIQGTVESRLRVTPTPTTPPSPVDAVTDAVGGVGGVILSIWRFFGFGGLLTQVLCCLLLPGLVLLGILRDPPRR